MTRSDFTRNEDGFVDAIRNVISYGAAVVGVSFRAPAAGGPSNSINRALRDAFISWQIGVWVNPPPPLLPVYFLFFSIFVVTAADGAAASGTTLTGT